MNQPVPFCFGRFVRRALHQLSPIAKPLAAVAVLGLGLAGPVSAQSTTGAGYVRWSMYRNAQDSVALRSAGISATSAALNRYVVSNGQMPASGTTAAPYSQSRGQAFAITASGGGWASTATPPGPGSTPRRGYYEKFSVTASSLIHFDSLIFTTAATSSGSGRLALTYSLSNYTADSSNFSGGKCPNYAPSPGGVLPATADGSFPLTNSGTTTTFAALPQFVGATGNTGTFRFGFRGATGIILRPGQTLTVHLNFVINNSMTGRYILLKNVIMQGRRVSATAVPVAKVALAMYPNPAQDQLLVAHPAAQAGARVFVYSAIGQQVLRATPSPGTTSTDLNLANLAAGIYLVEYADGTQRITGKVKITD